MNYSVTQWFFDVFRQNKSQMVSDGEHFVITIGDTCFDGGQVSLEEAFVMTLEAFYVAKGRKQSERPTDKDKTIAELKAQLDARIQEIDRLVLAMSEVKCTCPGKTGVICGKCKYFMETFGRR